MRKNDAELVLEIQSGNHKAFVLLVKRWHKQFCNKAYFLTKDSDSAKDIAQDTWKTIINKIDKLKDPNSFGSWAIRIVYNESIDFLNAKNRKLRQLETFNYGQTEMLIESDNNSELIKAKLLKTIKLLPTHQQVVIKLFYMQDYSLKEISDILNISVGTTKSRLFHAREKLKIILKVYNYEK